MDEGRGEEEVPGLEGEESGPGLPYAVLSFVFIYTFPLSGGFEGAGDQGARMAQSGWEQDLVM